MKMNRKPLLNKALFWSLALCVLLATTASAGPLMVASGAGYKKPVTEVLEAFKKDTGIAADAVFGNMEMIASQAKQTGEVACVIGDKKFLDGLAPALTFAQNQPIGKGILVLAYRKDLAIEKPEDMATDKVKTIFMPEEKKAIYGIAGAEALKAYGYAAPLAGKITQVATVPQVVSYLISGEADTGFINLTEALASRDKIGGFLTIPEDRYAPIMIVAGVVQGFEANPQAQKFIAYLETAQAKQIFEKYGLK